MLFMTIFTWEPEKTDEVGKRRLETVGKPPPKGVKELGRWAQISGGRSFVLSDVSDPKAYVEALRPWRDLGKFEVIPVLEGEKMVKLIPK
jgi:hypothetical protein